MAQMIEQPLAAHEASQNSGSESDNDLIQRFQTGDRASLQRLVSRHYANSFRLARRILADPAAAEDSVQTAFIRTYRNLQSFDTTQPFKPWFHRILMNAIKTEYTRRKKRWNHERTAAQTVPIEVASVTEEIEQRELRRQLQDLNCEAQALIIWHYFEQQSQQQIAANLGVSQATVSRKLQSALNGLRAKLVAAGLAVAVGSLPSKLYAMEQTPINCPKPPDIQTFLKLNTGANAMKIMTILISLSLGLLSAGTLLSGPETKPLKPRQRTANTSTDKQSRPKKTPNNDQIERAPANKTRQDSSNDGSTSAKPTAAKPAPAQSEQAQKPEPKTATQAEKFAEFTVYRWTDEYLGLVDITSVGQLNKRAHKVRAQLDYQLCELKYDDGDVFEVLKEIQWQTGIAIDISPAAARIIETSGAKVSYRLSGITIKSCLKLIVVGVSNSLDLLVRGERVSVVVKETLASNKIASKSESDQRYRIPNWIREYERRIQNQVVTLNFNECPLEDTINFIQSITGLNLVLATDLNPDKIKVSMQLKQCHLDKVLEILCRVAKVKMSFKNEALYFEAASPNEKSIVRTPQHVAYLKALKQLKTEPFKTAKNNLTDETLAQAFEELEFVDSIKVVEGIAARISIKAGQTPQGLLDTISVLSGCNLDLWLNSNNKLGIEFKPGHANNTLDSFVAELEADFTQYSPFMEDMVMEKGETLNEFIQAAFKTFKACQARLSDVSLDKSSVSQVVGKRKKSLETMIQHWPYQSTFEQSRTEDLFLKRGFITKLFKHQRSAESFGLKVNSFDRAHKSLAKPLGKN